MKRKLSKLAACAASMLLAVSGAAFAGTATTNVGVSANIANNCTVGNVSAIAFTYDPIVANHSTPAVAQGTIDVTCTSGATWSLDLDNGQNNGNATSPSNRAMKSGSSYLSYDIYQDTNHATLWLSGSGKDVTGTGSGIAQTQTMYGQVPAAQNIPAGTYNDTVVATVNF
jgi:spore coat protein U domain-containing protein, fimbrial subunit CupE1/2/3/6